MFEHVSIVSFTLGITYNSCESLHYCNTFNSEPHGNFGKYI